MHSPRSSFGLGLAGVFAIAVAGCGDSTTRPSGPGGGAPNKDASMGNNNADGGMNNGNTDGGGGGGGNDGGGGGGNDGGNPGPCDPVTGQGCGTQTCIYVDQTIRAQCRDLAMTTKGHEEVCSGQLQDCSAGFTCVQFQGEMMPRCRKVCNAGSDAACAGLTGTSTTGYGCLIGLDNEYGVCAPRPASCVAYDDMCPMGQYCQLAGTTLGCVPEGAQNVGDACGAQMRCKKGGICIGLQGGTGTKCYEPCDPANAMSCSSMNARCSGELTSGGTSLGFGVCGESSCNPLNPSSCMMNQVCEFVAGALTCVAEGTAGTGQDCSMSNCARGNICIFLQGTPGPRCYIPCDAGAMMNPCTMGMCRGLMNQSFGICN